MTNESPLSFGNTAWAPEKVQSVTTEPAQPAVQPRYVHVSDVYYDKPGSKYVKRIGKRQPKRYKLIARGVVHSPTK